MNEKKDRPTGTVDNPEARAFTGHPDHPPANPDQPVEGNQELLRQPDGDGEAEEQPTVDKAG